MHLAQYAARAKQHGARTVAQDSDDLSVARTGYPDPVGILGIRAQTQVFGTPQSLQVTRGINGSQDETGRIGRHAVGHGQVSAGPGRDFVGQDPGAARHQLRWFVRRGDITKVVEVSHGVP